MKKIIILYMIFFIILMNSFSEEYIGFGSMYGYMNLYTFRITEGGQIYQIGTIDIPGGPRRVVTNDKGLVLVVMSGLNGTFSVIKKEEDGQIHKIRDVDLTGQGHDIRFTKDGKYVIILHEINDNNDDFIDLGFSVYELNPDQTDIILPCKLFYSILDKNWVSHFDITFDGLIIGIWTSNLATYKFIENGTDVEIIDLQETIPADVLSNITITPDDKLALVTGDPPKDLLVFKIEEDNVIDKGFVETSGKAGTHIIVTPDSKVILEILLYFELATFEILNGDTGNIVLRQEFGGIDLGQGLGITPNGRFAVLGYDYSPGFGRLRVYQINEDRTVIDLGVDYFTPGGVSHMAFCPQKTTSVETNWQMYK